MLFKVVAVLLSSVLQAAVPAGGSSGSSARYGQSAEEHSIEAHHGTTNFVRKTKGQKQGSNKVEEDDEGDEAIAIDDGDSADEGEEVVPSFIPNLRTSAFNDSTDWNHGATAVSAAKSGTIKVYFPDGTVAGDTVFLFLSRTDGLLPLNIDNWTRGAECFKTRNRQDNCMRSLHCIQRDGDYCAKFRRGNDEGTGKDLGTVLFYRKVTSNDPGCITIELPGRTTTWAVATAVTNVNQNNPIRRVSGTSCDVAWESVFPSVYGEENDALLLSQSFDDTALRRDFLPPRGTDLLGFTNSNDEAGFLFGKRLDRTGQTGKLTTRGPGGPKCKDALLSVVVNRDE